MKGENKGSRREIEGTRAKEQKKSFRRKSKVQTVLLGENKMHEGENKM